jgi:type IV pilus assembly protein PilA
MNNYRRNAEAGFTLIELLIVMSLILILMTLAIPNLMSIRKHGNETSAIASLRAINTAELQYATTYPASQFACSLTSLGGTGAAGSSPTAQGAGLIPPDLTTGQKAGYTFTFSNCTKVSINNQDMYTGYQLTAVPQSLGKAGTGDRGFCTDQSGEIKSDPAGGTNCTQPIQ